MSGTKSNLELHAERELRAAGLFDKDSDYGGMMGEAVLRLIRTHAAEGHSGLSHSWALDLFTRLANFQVLTPLTNDPAEWMEVGPKLWQSKRQSDAFSEDGGATWYSVDDPKRERKPTATERKCGSCGDAVVVGDRRCPSCPPTATEREEG